MSYDKVNDEYSCHNNKKLKVIGKKIRKSKSEYELEISTTTI